MKEKREEAGYLQEKKIKQKKNKVRIGILILLLLAAAAGIFFYRSKEREAEENPNAEENVVLEKNQSWLYLEIEEITGNEIQAVAVTDNAGSEEEIAAGDAHSEDRIAAGDAHGRNTQADDGDESTDGEKTQSYLIPVGTDVVTKLGSVTTFSRLAAGDTIHCLTQQEDGETVILKIWIEE